LLDNSEIRTEKATGYRLYNQKVFFNKEQRWKDYTGCYSNYEQSGHIAWKMASDFTVLKN
jgi:hypothetical protein